MKALNNASIRSMLRRLAQANTRLSNTSGITRAIVRAYWDPESDAFGDVQHANRLLEILADAGKNHTGARQTLPMVASMFQELIPHRVNANGSLGKKDKRKANSKSFAAIASGEIPIAAAWNSAVAKAADKESKQKDTAKAQKALALAATPQWSAEQTKTSMEKAGKAFAEKVLGGKVLHLSFDAFSDFIDSANAHGLSIETGNAMDAEKEKESAIEMRNRALDRAESAEARIEHLEIELEKARVALKTRTTKPRTTKPRTTKPDLPAAMPQEKTMPL